VRIQPLDSSTADAARLLVIKVFGREGRFHSWAYTTQPNHSLGKLWSRLWGLKGLPEIWVAIDDEDDKVIGTIGLYSTRADNAEALWVWYFCVDPEARGKKVGSNLLDFVIAQAKQRNASKLRLLTSNEPSAATAQVLYESRGLEVYKSINLIFFRVLFREMSLDGDV